MRTPNPVWRSLLLSVPGLVWAMTVCGQTIPVVRIDPFTHAAQQNAPFDRTFYLWMPVDTTLEMDEIDQLNLNRMNKKGSKLPFDTIATWTADELERARFVDTVKIPKSKYLQVFINQQLLPNTRFSVVLFIRATHEYLD